MWHVYSHQVCTELLERHDHSQSTAWPPASPSSTSLAPSSSAGAPTPVSTRGEPLKGPHTVCTYDWEKEGRERGEWNE